MFPDSSTEQRPRATGQRRWCTNGQTGAVLLLIDLDNTLIDRTAAFKSWAAQYVATHGGDASDVDWMMTADRDGYEPRERLAGMIGDRFGIDRDRMLTELRSGVVEYTIFDPAVGRALRDATAAGFVPVVVTNGLVRQQEAKLRHTGLDRLVAGWMISEGAGVRKPDRRIFELAAESVGHTPADGGWMIGDHPEYDIVGGAAAGLDTIWLPRGAEWPESAAGRPTYIADDFPAAVAFLLSQVRE
jgi:putative hydrolase of the HAD superfamily